MHFYINTISTALNENKYCIGLFLNFKKAFDTVPHDILLKKTGKNWESLALNWFASYLSNRTQKVEVNAPSLILKSSTYLSFKVHA